MMSLSSEGPFKEFKKCLVTSCESSECLLAQEGAGHCQSPPRGGCRGRVRLYSSLLPPVSFVQVLCLFYKHLRHWFIHSFIKIFIHLSHPFPPNLQNTINPKPFERGTWNFYTMFTTCHVPCVTCHISQVTCHVSHVPLIFFPFFSLFFLLVELVGRGYVINCAYPV